MSEAQATPNQSARRKAATAFNDRAERQVTADMKRIEEQRLYDQKMAAKTQRLRAIRLERDAALAKAAAEEAAAQTVAGPKKRIRAKTA